MGLLEARRTRESEEILGTDAATRALSVTVVENDFVAGVYEKLASVYDHIDLTLLDFAPTTPFSVDLAAHLPGAGSQEIRLQGKGGPLATDPGATPFQGNLTLKQVQISGLQKITPSMYVKTK